MEAILGAIGIGVTVLLFLVAIIIKQGRDHRTESNRRLDDTTVRIDRCNDGLAHTAVSVARIETSVGHLSANVDGLTRWKDDLQERTIARLREDRSALEDVA